MQQVERVKISTLKQHPNNPRRGDVDAIAESLIINGQIGAIVVQTKTRRVIGGNHTLRAAKQIGWEEIDVIWRDVDDEQAKRELLVLNRASDLADYDNDALLNLLRSLDDLVGSGYDEEAMRLLLDDETPDFMPDDDEDVRLDRKSVTDCPKCGHTFTPVTRSIVDEP
jgi:ParB-like chromosome segregation protein Spo0J